MLVTDARVVPSGRRRVRGPIQRLYLRVAPHSAGPGAHCHETNEELFYVIEGTITFIVGDQRIDALAGSFLRVPAGVTHDFENNTARPAGVFNVFIPGGFEARMPAMVEWYRAETHIEAAGIDSGCRL